MGALGKGLNVRSEQIGTYSPAMDVTLLPRNDRQNAWLEILPPLPEAQVLRGNLTFDHVVVGGGYGGLSVARRLAELAPDESIALIEADRVGNNAAGRCSGFIIDHAHNIRAKGFADDTENAKRGIELNRAGLDWLREIVSRENIDCDWRDEGKIHAAASPKGVEMLANFAESLDAVHEDYTMLDAGELHRRFGTSFYRSGMLTPYSSTCQPAALAVGLARTFPDNVTVFEQSPVTGVDYGPPHLLRTDQGTVRTPSLVLAANGFGEGFGFFEKSLIPLITWGSMTRVLTDDEVDRLGGLDNYAIIPAHPAGTTVRRLPERRILIRNQYTYSATSNAQPGRDAARRVHQKSFEARYPMLNDVEFEYTWGGALSLSRNGAGVCGQVAPGVHATMVYQGTGMAKGAISGRYLAELMMGEDPPLRSVLTGGSTPSRNFPDPFNRWGVRLNARWRRWQAGIEE
jgi:glycine/D-amino acid oxidase-like deaminating enzyme